MDELSKDSDFQFSNGDVQVTRKSLNTTGEPLKRWLLNGVNLSQQLLANTLQKLKKTREKGTRQLFAFVFTVSEPNEPSST